MHPIQPRRLHGLTAWSVTTLVGLPVFLGFALPTAHLIWLTWRRFAEGQGLTPGLIDGILNSAGLALGVTAITLAAGLIVAWAARPSAGGWSAQSWLARCASLGYAIPGTVLAIGLMTPALHLDAWMAEWLSLPGLPMMGLGGILAVACVLRFLAMPVGNLEAGLTRLPPHLEQASRSLGESATSTLRRVHLPLLRPALLASGLMVFIDVMKELPTTLLLRPANFETLSTLLYADASRGSYENGAMAALLIVLVGLPAVILLSRTQRDSINPTDMTNTPSA
jgi:iron(III) transport system permease protein